VEVALSATPVVLDVSKLELVVTTTAIPLLLLAALLLHGKLAGVEVEAEAVRLHGCSVVLLAMTTVVIQGPGLTVIVAVTADTAVIVAGMAVAAVIAMEAIVETVVISLVEVHHGLAIAMEAVHPGRSKTTTRMVANKVDMEIVGMDKALAMISRVVMVGSVVVLLHGHRRRPLLLQTRFHHHLLLAACRHHHLLLLDTE